MLKRSLIIGMGALLLAGFTATVADAGEARKGRGKVVVEDEDQRKVRRPAKTPVTRTPVTRRGPSRREEVKTTRRPAHRPEPRVKVVPQRRPAHRPKVVPQRRPAHRPTVAPQRRPAHRPTVVHPGRRTSGRLHSRPLPHPANRRPALQWVEGRYEVRIRQVWVPGYYRTERVPARYAVRKGYLGLLFRVRIQRECTKKVWVSGHHRDQRERVWVPGHWIRAPHGQGGHVRHR